LKVSESDTAEGFFPNKNARRHEKPGKIIPTLSTPGLKHVLAMTEPTFLAGCFHFGI